MKKFSLIVTTLLCLLTVIPVHAQQFTPEERELIQFVHDAYESLLQLKAFKAQVETSMVQDMTLMQSGQEIAINQNITQSSTSQILNDPSGGINQLYTVMDQNMVMDAGIGGTQEQALTMEMVFTNGEIFLRYSNIPPEQAYLFPTDWITPEDMPGGELFNTDFFDRLTGTEALSLYPVTEENIVSIRELPGESIDGQDMRVFEIVWHTDKMLAASGAADMFNTAALGDLGTSIMEGISGNSDSLQRIWIGAADGIVYQITFDMSVPEIPISSSFGDLTLSLESTTITTYFDFNRPVDIPNPDLAE